MSVVHNRSRELLELERASRPPTVRASQDDRSHCTADASGNCRKKARQQQLRHDEDSSQQPRSEPRYGRPSADPEAPPPAVHTHQALGDEPCTRSSTSDEATHKSAEHDAHQRKGRAVIGQTVIHLRDYQEGQTSQHCAGQQGLPEDAISASSSRASSSTLDYAHVATLRMDHRSHADTLPRRGAHGRRQTDRPSGTSPGSRVACTDLLSGLVPRRICELVAAVSLQRLQ